MVNKLLALLSASALLFVLAAPMCAQEAKKKEARWEGNVIRTNPEKSTLDVRQVSGQIVKTIHYDSSTKWVSAYHASKKQTDIDASQVKEGDRVICLGTYDDKKEFHATQISKRLSHSPSD